MFGAGDFCCLIFPLTVYSTTPMKTIILLSLLIISLENAFGQKMQEFNQLYYEKEYKKKVDKRLNQLKATAAVVPFVPAPGSSSPVEDAQANAEAESKADVSGPTSINEISGLPAFTDLLSDDVVLPKMEITGVTNFNSEAGIYGDVKLFTSGVSAKQTSYTKMFFTETSTYGISMSFNYLPEFAIRNFKRANGDEQEESHWICAYVSANYLGKNLYGVTIENGVADTTKFSSAFGHLKYGVQVIPFKNLLSFYADLNHIIGLTNRDPLIKHASSLSNGFTNFLNIGTKFILATDPGKKPLNLFVDISGVVMRHSLKKIYDTSDKIIPRISIGSEIRF